MSQDDGAILSLPVGCRLAGLQHVTVTTSWLIIDLFVDVLLSLVVTTVSIACVVLVLVPVIDQTLNQYAIFLIRVVQSTVRLVGIVIMLLRLPVRRRDVLNAQRIRHSLQLILVLQLRRVNWTTTVICQPVTTGIDLIAIICFLRIHVNWFIVVPCLCSLLRFVNSCIDIVDVFVVGLFITKSLVYQDLPVCLKTFFWLWWFEFLNLKSVDVHIDRIRFDLTRTAIEIIASRRCSWRQLHLGVFPRKKSSILDLAFDCNIWRIQHILFLFMNGLLRISTWVLWLITVVLLGAFQAVESHLSFINLPGSIMVSIAIFIFQLLFCSQILKRNAFRFLLLFLLVHNLLRGDVFSAL